MTVLSSVGDKALLESYFLFAETEAGERDNRVSEVKDPGFLSSADMDFQHNLRLKAKHVVM